MSDKKLIKVQEKEDEKHVFWDTQPVPHSSVETIKVGPIEIKTVDEVRKEPLSLPEQFEWVEIEVNDKKELEVVYKLLNENYVEDDDNMFRFDYSASFLKWALQPPGYHKDWHIGVRVKASKQLVAFISAIPATIAVDGNPVNMVEINFLCVHKRLRSKRLAPVLIKEITRRVNLRDVWQATYTAGIVIPTPISSTTYYHRSLNPKKLIDIGFSSLPPKTSLAVINKLYRVNEQPKFNIQPLQKNDVPSVTLLLNNYLKKFKVATHYTEDDIWHWFEPRNEVVVCYVIKGDSNSPNTVTDFFSFYNLSSSIIRHPKHTHLKAAYSYYNVVTTVSLIDLMNDALHIAKKLNYDVFNCLNILDNDKFISPLKFAMGDGNLQYYFYNYAFPERKPDEIGLVLL